MSDGLRCSMFCMSDEFPFLLLSWPVGFSGLVLRGGRLMCV